jgi:integrase
MRVNLKGIHTTFKRLADGSERIYYYAWRGGPRLSGKPGTPQFVDAYDKAIAELRPVKATGTLQTLLDAYQRSTDFRSKAPPTRSDYVKQIRKIEAKFGTFPVVGLSGNTARGVFKEWRDELALKSERRADYTWTVLALVLSWSKDRGMIDKNPCEKGGRVYTADRNCKIWTDDDEAKFLASAPSHLALALTLALWTGQRQGDLLNLKMGPIDGEWIRFRQSKTGTYVEIPVAASLKAVLDAEKKMRGTLILMSTDDLPWTNDGFRASWGKAVKKAGITGITFNDTRRSAVTRLAVAECSVPEIATITGHSLRDVQAILDAHYRSRDPEMARSAIRKLESRTKTTNQPTN